MISNVLAWAAAVSVQISLCIIYKHVHFRLVGVEQMILILHKADYECNWPYQKKKQQTKYKSNIMHTKGFVWCVRSQNTKKKQTTINKYNTSKMQCNILYEEIQVSTFFVSKMKRLVMCLYTYTGVLRLLVDCLRTSLVPAGGAFGLHARSISAWRLAVFSMNSLWSTISCSVAGISSGSGSFSKAINGKQKKNGLSLISAYPR